MGVSRFSVENFLVSLVPKFSEDESFTAALFSGIEEVWIKVGGSIKIFCRKLYVSQCRKFS